MFYKIINLIPQNGGRCDYKGLNIDKFISGSQVYSVDLQNNICLIGSTEDVAETQELKKLTEEQYNLEKQNILQANEEYIKNHPAPPSKEETEKTITKAIAELSVENKKKDAMITNLAQTVANLNIEVTKMKGSVK